MKNAVRGEWPAGIHDGKDSGNGCVAGRGDLPGGGLVRDKTAPPPYPMGMTIRKDFLPFSVPGIDEDDIRAVADVLRSGWITTGARAGAFEAAVAEYTGAANACALTSGTAGWHCVAHALGLKPGDEVIMPSMTWISDANVVELLGATPVFADVDPDTLLMTPALAEAKITPRTRVLLPVHYAGAPVDLDGFRALADRYHLRLIEDAAHAIGTAYKGKRIGATGTAIFSLHPIKNITTAEGGLVTTDDSELFAAVKRFKFHGIAKDAWDRYSKKGSGTVSGVVEPGLKYNMPDTLAALGCTQLAKLDRFNVRRTELADHYDAAFAEIPEIRPLAPPPYPHTHAHHLYVVRLDTPRFTRDAFLAALRERNIGTGIHFKPAHTHPFYAEKYPDAGATLPATEWSGDRLFSLPLFPAMTDDDLQDVVAAIRDALA